MSEHIVGKTSDIDEGTGKTFTIEGQTIEALNMKKGLKRLWILDSVF